MFTNHNGICVDFAPFYSFPNCGDYSTFDPGTILN